MAEPEWAVPCTQCGTPYPVAAANVGRGVVCPHCGARFTLTPPADPPPPLDEGERQVAGLAVRLQLLTAEQAGRAASVPMSAGNPPGSRFVVAGLLTQAQLDHLLATLAFKEERLADTRFGHLAVEHGWANAEQIAAALEEQKRAFLGAGRSVPVGELLVQHGVLTKNQCEELLAAQQRARQKPAPQPNAIVLIAPDRMSASVMIPAGSPPPAVDQLHSLLTARGVSHGIDPARLEAIAAGRTPPGEATIVASATLPTPPEPGKVEYLFDTHPLRGARERGEGLIDYRDRGDIPQVAAGALLARVTPPVPGKAGSNVLGQALAPPKPKEAPLRVGKGAELTPDRLSALATVDGRPSLSAAGTLSVYPEYEIKGDVDLNTGHVNFHGRVVVAGAVRSGFRVRCGELVAQEIEAAEVEAEGDVTINGGIIRAHVRTGGTLRARYLHQSRVEALGDVVVAREVVDSQVETSGLFDSPECTLLASRVSAMNGITAREIGSESSTPCHILAGVDERVQNETTRLQQEAKAQVTACDELRRRIGDATARSEAIALEIGPLAQQQDQAMVSQRELERTKGGAAQARLAALKQQTQGLEARLENLFAEQEALKKQLEADNAAFAVGRELIAGLKAEVAQLQEWAAGRTSRFALRAGLIHQQTLVTSPHLEVRLESDRKAVNLTERERTEQDGHTSWHLVAG